MKIPANVTDKLWSALFCLIVIVAGPGSMFLGALMTNVMLGPPIEASYHGVKAVIEFVLLFGSLFCRPLPSMQTYRGAHSPLCCTRFLSTLAGTI
jgi:hypothetical protein